MRVWYMSDMHLRDLEESTKDYYREAFSGVETKDWLIIAGDVSSDVGIIKESLEFFSSFVSHLFFVYGNHDIYSRDLNISRVKDELVESLKESSNIHILDNSEVELEGYRIVGSSNWYNLPDNYSRAWWSTFSNDSRFVFSSARESNDFSEVDTKFLESLSSKVDILITHVPPIHLPNSTYEENYAYFCKPELSIEPTYWVCGHQHVRYEGDFGSSKLLVNPKGYVGELDGFELKYFELGEKNVN